MLSASEYLLPKYKLNAVGDEGITFVPKPNMSSNAVSVTKLSSLGATRTTGPKTIITR